MKKRIASLLLALVMIISLIPTGAITASAASLAVSEAGIRVIKDYMGFKKDAYQVGTQWRIGYGTEGVQGQVITEANADIALREVLAQCNAVVNSLGVDMVQKRHDALVWLTYVYGAGWKSSALAGVVANPAATSSQLANAMCTYDLTGDFAADAAAYSQLTTRMAIANLYWNGVYGTANTGSYSYTVFNAGDGAFAGGAKRQVMIYDRNQGANIAVGAPVCSGRTFLGWYDGATLINGLNGATAGKELFARWQTGADKVPAMYTLPAYAVYEASGLADTAELVVRADASSASARIDVISREGTVSVKSEKIVGTDKWLELTTGGWVFFGSVAVSLPSYVPNVNVTITDDYVNIRQDPSVASPKVGTAKRGETRTIVMLDGSGKWGYCSQGWLYLAYTSYYNTPSIPVTGTPGTVAGAEAVNVRSAAGVKNALVTKLNQGTGVTVYEQTTVDGATWGRIDQGWISMQYVQLKQVDLTDGNAPLGSTVTVSSTASLNVRSGPGTQYTKVGLLAPGTSVVVLRKQTVGGVTWALIDQGWINMNYVTGGSASGVSGNGIGGTIVNCVSGVNIRSAAGTTGALVGVATLGSRISVTERVQVNGHYWGHMDRGWVCMDYVQLDQEFPSDNSANTPVVDDVVASSAGYPAVTVVEAVVRQTASSDAAALMTLKSGVSVDITDRTVVGTNTFGKVTVGTTTGWVNLSDVRLSQVNAKVTVAKADAYEMPNLRSHFFASLIQGTTVTVGNADGSGWQLADGMLWGQTTVTVGGVERTAWIKMNDVSMFKANVMPTGKTTLSGVGYLTGTINANTIVYKDSNGNVTAEEAGYTLTPGHRVNIQARNLTGSATYGKVTVGNVTGWINMASVALDTVVQQATSQIAIYDNSFNNTSYVIPAGSKITVLARQIVTRDNEINNGIADFGLVYVGDDINTRYWIRLDEGKLVNVTTPTAPNASTPSVVIGLSVTGTANGNIDILEDAIIGSRSLLNIKDGSAVTVLNWKNVDGITWGKVQIGSIVGWVQTSSIDFTDMTAVVAVDELSVYSAADKAATRQVLRVNSMPISLLSAPVFDGSVVWGQISVADKTGWIDLSDVVLSTPGAGVNTEVHMASGKVNSVTADVTLEGTGEVKSLPKDTEVTLVGLKLESDVAYWKVALTEKSGWMEMANVTVNPVTATIAEASAEIYNDLTSIGTGNEKSLYTMYRGEKITVTSFAIHNSALYGMVTYGSTNGWIRILNSANQYLVSLAPGAYGNSYGGSTGTTTPTTPVTPTEPTAPAGTEAYISCSSYVNVRAAADPTSALVTTLPNGTAISITEQTTYIGKGWAKIEQGWVCMDYVKMGKPPVNVNTGSGNVSIMTTVPAGAIAVGFANQDVKIRSGSNMGYPETGSVKKGNSLVIYEKKLDGGMSWGRTDNGWVCLSYLTITGIGVSGSGSMGTIANCGSTANVRGTASSGGPLMAKVMVNSRVAVYETMAVGAETWARTDLGWIVTTYIAMDTVAESLPGTGTTVPTEPTAPAGDGSVG